MGRKRQHDTDMPPRIYRRRGTWYWARPDDGGWVRLSKNTDEALTIYAQLTHTEESPLISLRRVFKSCQNNARLRNLEMKLEWRHVLELWARSEGRCELTGTTFTLANPKNWTRHPFAPSIDRINSRTGYLPSNVRLVCVAVNVALSEWGDEVYEVLARGFLRTRLKYRRKAARIEQRST